MNRNPKQEPAISLAPKPDGKIDFNLEIMDLMKEISKAKEEKGDNTEKIRGLTSKMSSLQDARDLHYSVAKNNSKKSAGGWNEADTDGDPFKRGNSLR